MFVKTIVLPTSSVCCFFLLFSLGIGNTSLEENIFFGVECSVYDFGVALGCTLFVFRWGDITCNFGGCPLIHVDHPGRFFGSVFRWGDMTCYFGGCPLIYVELPCRFSLFLIGSMAFKATSRGGQFDVSVGKKSTSVNVFQSQGHIPAFLYPLIAVDIFANFMKDFPNNLAI